nr:VCBS repeat-containing protein [Micromonospora sp. DSM 115978]
MKALLSAVISLVTLAALLTVPAASAQAAFTWRGDDYNWDGYSDLLSVGDENSDVEGCMIYHPATGTGGFHYWGHPERCYWTPNYLGQLTAIGDLNNDGQGDLASISYEDKCLYVWWGVTNGYFSNSVRIGCDWSPYGELAGPGDINSDGNADMLAILSGQCLYSWLGNGAGGFSARRLVGCGWDDYAHLTTPGDLNRDGRPDLVAINLGTNCMWRWYGDGRGNFHAGTEIGCGWAPYRHGLVGLEDINGDGNGDLVASNSYGSLFAWYGLGAGGFTAAHQINGMHLPNRVLIG